MDQGFKSQNLMGFVFLTGCSGIQVEEIYSLDEASLEDLRSLYFCFGLFPFLVTVINLHIIFVSLYCSYSRPVHGLIFLFKWKPGEEPAGPIVHESRSLGIFFAKQVSQ